MKRRYFIQLGVGGLAGCGTGPQTQQSSVKAGPFAVTIPANWRKSTIVEKKSIHPLYTSEAWKDYQKDSSRSLKPGYYCRPQHWALRIPAALPDGIGFDGGEADDNETAPQILIHKADEWGVAFTDGKHRTEPAAETKRSLREQMDAAMTSDDPHLSPGYMDASLEFMCLKRRINFAGGRGVRLVTQWAIESDLIRLGQLHYLFIGLSDDDSCQIIATFPINLPGLPDDDGRSHLGRSTKDYQEFSRHYSEYVEDAKKWLEKHAEEITPSIRTLDGMMESLVASHWE